MDINRTKLSIIAEYSKRAQRTHARRHTQAHTQPQNEGRRGYKLRHTYTRTQKRGLPYEKHATRHPSNPKNTLVMFEGHENMFEGYENMLEGYENMLEGQTFRPFKHRTFTQPAYTQHITQNHDVRRAKIPTLRTYFPALRTCFPTLRA